MSALPRIQTAAFDAVILYLGDQPDESLSRRIGQLSQLIRQQLSDVLLALTPSYTSILIQYNSLLVDEAGIRARIEQLLAEGENTATRVDERRCALPVCYAESLAPDLALLSQQTGLTADEIAAIHCAKSYAVLAIGFSPGFGYMGEVDARIRVPRHATPRTSVPAGSVALAEQYTAVYPQSTPGGWWLIGRCPLMMFDKQRTPMSLIEVGDRVSFEAVSLDDFNHLKEHPDDWA